MRQECQAAFTSGSEFVVALAHLLSEIQAPCAPVAGEAENAADVIVEDNLGKEARITIVKR
jgi:hypothetical protein